MIGIIEFEHLNECCSSLGVCTQYYFCQMCQLTFKLQYKTESL